MSNYPITQNLIPNLPRNPYRKGASAYEGVVGHATDNTAPAINERNYEANGHWQDAFVHFFVDWTNIIQAADTDYICWGCGPVGNQRFVQVELCQTSDPNMFQESYKRYVWLLAKILYDKKLGVSLQGTLWGHDDVSKVLGGTDHTDPYAYLASHGISKEQFVADVKAQYDAMCAPAKPLSTPAEGNWKKENGVWHYYENGNLKTNDWVKYKNNWYYLKADGSMAQGWLQYNNNWYYLNPATDRGEMLTGWIHDNGKTYYCNPEPDKGEMFTGVHVISGKSYSFKINGELIQ